MSSSSSDMMLAWIACFDGISLLAAMMEVERGGEVVADAVEVMAAKEYKLVCLKVSFDDSLVEIFCTRRSQ